MLGGGCHGGCSLSGGGSTSHGAPCSRMVVPADLWESIGTLFAEAPQMRLEKGWRTLQVVVVVVVMEVVEVPAPPM